MLSPLKKNSMYTALPKAPTGIQGLDEITAGGTAGPTAELSVTKTLTTPAPYHHGDTLSYDIVVHNNGPSTATNVLVQDHPIGVDPSSMSGGGCTNVQTHPNGGSTDIRCTKSVSFSGLVWLKRLRP